MSDCLRLKSTNDDDSNLIMNLTIEFFLNNIYMYSWTVTDECLQVQNHCIFRPCPEFKFKNSLLFKKPVKTFSFNFILFSTLFQHPINRKKRFFLKFKTLFQINFLHTKKDPLECLHFGDWSLCDVVFDVVVAQDFFADLAKGWEVLKQVDFCQIVQVVDDASEVNVSPGCLQENPWEFNSFR